MDTGVRRSYKDKLKLRTKPRMQTNLFKTERPKYVKNYEPVESSEPKQIEDGEEGKIVEILKSDENPLMRKFVIDQDSGQYSSVKYIHQILDGVLSSVLNLARSL